MKKGTRLDKLTNIYYVKPSKLPEIFLATVFEYFRGEDLLRDKVTEFYPEGFNKTESIKRSQQAALIIATAEWVPIKTANTVRHLMEKHSLEESDFKSLEPSNSENYGLIPKPGPRISLSLDQSRLDPSLSSEENSSSEEEVTQVNVIKTEMTDKARNKSELTPVWRNHVDQQLQANELNHYISALKRANEAGWFTDSQSLIVQSLMKSGKEHVLASLPPGSDSDLDQFVRYLHQYYGLSDDQQREALHQLKQAINEPIIAFMARTLQLFSQVRHPNQRVKTFAEMDQAANKVERDEIISIVLRGLQNAQLRLALMQSRHELTLSNMADRAKQLQVVLPAATVNMVEAQMQNTLMELCKKVDVLYVGAKDRFRSDKSASHNTGKGAGTKKKIKCWFCSKLGHVKSECRSYKSWRENNQKSESERAKE